jgi:hypothetical protein
MVTLRSEVWASALLVACNAVSNDCGVGLSEARVQAIYTDAPVAHFSVVRAVKERDLTHAIVVAEHGKDAWSLGYLIKGQMGNEWHRAVVSHTTSFKRLDHRPTNEEVDAFSQEQLFVNSPQTSQPQVCTQAR